MRGVSTAVGPVRTSCARNAGAPLLDQAEGDGAGDGLEDVRQLGVRGGLEVVVVGVGRGGRDALEHVAVTRYVVGVRDRAGVALGGGRRAALPQRHHEDLDAFRLILLRQVIQLGIQLSLARELTSINDAMVWLSFETMILCSNIYGDLSKYLS